MQYYVHIEYYYKSSLEKCTKDNKEDKYVKRGHKVKWLINWLNQLWKS